MQNSGFRTRITRLYRCRPHLWFFAFKRATLEPELQVSMGPHPSSMVFAFKQRLLVYCSQTSPVDLWMQNSMLRRRMTLVYWSQPSSLVLCIQNSDFSNRNTSLYGSQPSFAPFACKTATLGPELLVSMCPRPHLSCCACKTTLLASE